MLIFFRFAPDCKVPKVHRMLRLHKIFTLALISLLSVSLSKAQTKEFYATSQENGTSGVCICSVQDEDLAVDRTGCQGDTLTNSNLLATASLLGGTISQTLIWDFGDACNNTGDVVGQPGDTIIVKLGSGNIPLSISTFANVTITSFLGGTSNNDGKTVNTSAITLLSSSTFEVIFNPTNNWDRIQISLNAGLLGLATQCQIFGARIVSDADDDFVFPDGSGIGFCDAPDSVSTELAAPCLQGLCNVENPGALLTASESDFVVLRNDLALAGGRASVIANYGDPTCPSDSAVIVFGFQGGILTTSLLSSVQVTGLLDGVEVAGPETMSTSTLTALGGAGGPTYAYTFKPGVPINQVRVSLVSQGLSAFNAVRVYQVCLRRLLPPTPKGGLNIAYACYNDFAQMEVNERPGTTSIWYASDGSVVATGPTYNAGPVTAADTIKIVASDIDGCQSLDSLTYFVIPYTPGPIPAATSPGIAYGCYGDTLNIIPGPLGQGYTFAYYRDDQGTIPVSADTSVFVNTSYAYFPVRERDTIWAQTQVPGVFDCVSDTYTPFVIDLIPEQFPVQNPDTLFYCEGDPSIEVGVFQQVPDIKYRWYNRDSVLISEGVNLDTIGYTVDETVVPYDSIFVEAVFGICDSSANWGVIRFKSIANTSFTPTVPAGRDSIITCAYDTVYAVASTTYPAVIKWYNAASGGNFLGEGDSLMVIDNGGTITVWAEAVAGACSSSSGRVPVTIISGATLPFDFNDQTISVCEEEPVTLRLPEILGGTVEWFTSPVPFVGETPVAVGPEYFVPGGTGTFEIFFEYTNYFCGENTQRFSYLITYVNQGGISVEAADDVVAFCAGDSATLEGTGAFLGSSDTPTLYWIEAGGDTLGTGSPYVVTPAQLASYAYPLKVYLSGALDSCSVINRDSLTIVNLTGVAAPTVVSPLQICDDQTVTITPSHPQFPGAVFNFFNAGMTQIATEEPYYNTEPLTSNATFFVRLAIDGNCASETAAQVDVQVFDQLTAPVIDACGINNADSVGFTWSAVSGADSYTVKYTHSRDGMLVDERTVTGITGTTFSLTTGVESNDQVTISVRAVSNSLPCRNSEYSDPQTCSANGCGFDNLKISSSFLEGCEDDTLVLVVNNISDSIQSGTTFRVVGEAPGTVTYTTTGSIQPPFEFVFAGLVSGRYRDTLVIENADLNCGGELAVRIAFEIVVYETPVLDIDVTPLVPATAGSFVNRFQFISNTRGVVDALWEFGDGQTSTEKNPIHEYDNEGIYDVFYTATNLQGCSARGQLARRIVVTRNPEIFIPNTFTPNGDGKNDMFRVFGQNVRLEILQVYNTFGNLMFESNSLTEGWNGLYDGKEVPMGDYYYKAIIRDEINQKIEREGTVSLIRK